MGYKVLLADDEKDIIDLIRMLGRWDTFDMEIAATSMDGTDALKKIIAIRPDIVITDVRMPGLDGIRLIREVRKNGIDCLFILFSGYRQFDYAKNAVALNVLEYLLKPISAQQLNDALEKAYTRLRADDISREDKRTLSRMKEHELQERYDDFWRQLIYPWNDDIFRANFKSPADIRERFLMDFPHGVYQVALINADVPDGMENRHSHFSAEVSEKIQKCLSPHAVFYHFMKHRGCNVVINYPGGNEKEVRSALSALYYEIRDLKEIYGAFYLSLGVSETHTSCTELKQAFLEARAAEWGKLVMTQSGVLWHYQVSGLSRIDTEEIISRAEAERICDCMKYLRRDELERLFRDIEARAPVYFSAYPGCVAQAYYHLLDSLDHVLPADDVDKVHASGDHVGNESRSYLQLMYNLHRKLDAYLEERLTDAGRKGISAVTGVIRFIERNYEKQITLEEAAESVHLTGAYLSRMFKEETGEGFLQYLTRMRIREAEKLLAETNRPIRLVAQAVGYPDEKYFARLYKKQTGITPGEYRRNMAGHGQDALHAVEWDAENARSLDILRKRLQLKMMQSQMNPHFLYNTLDTIRAKALTRGENEIADMTRLLADYFSYCIGTEESLVRISEELRHIADYFEIQRYRFGDRFSFQVTVTDDTLPDLYMPRMTLQPLVENAMIHGLEKRGSGGMLSVDLRRKGKKLLITVTDNGPGMDSRRLSALNEELALGRATTGRGGSVHGIAIPNANARIRMMFGDVYGISYRRAKPQGMCVVVTLPFVDDFVKTRYEELLI